MSHIPPRGTDSPSGAECLAETAQPLPYPDKVLHGDPCPGCQHPLGLHVVQFGCVNGWSWYGDGPLAGLSKSEGCECPLTLAEQYDPPDEGDV